MSNHHLHLPTSLQSSLDKWYTHTQPDDHFVNQLENQLRQHQMKLLSPENIQAPSSQKMRPVLSLNGRNNFMRIFRTHPMMAVITALLALLLLTGIVYAVGRITGFIPGIGFVQDVQSVLEKPVVVERDVINTPVSGDTTAVPELPVAQSEGDTDTQAKTILTSQERKGITISIEKAVSEAHQLVINFSIAGLPPNQFGPERGSTLQAYMEAHPDEPMLEQIRLPDGTLLGRVNGGMCSGGGDLTSSWLTCRSVYAPLPDGFNQFSLEIQRLPNTLPGELPEGWNIPIQLTPVISGQATGDFQQPNLRSQPVEGFTLLLDKIAQNPEQTAFQLAMEWEGANCFIHHTAPITLQDDQGRYYVLASGPEGGIYSIDRPNFATLPSLVTSPVDGSSPLTIRMNWILVSVSTSSDADDSAAILKFSPGSNAKAGQEWTLDQTFKANELNLHFIKARIKAAQDGAFILEFDIQAPSAVKQINLFPKDVESSSTESGYDKARGLFVSRVTLPALPTQPVDLYVSEVVYRLNGPWEITWQPQRVNTIFPTPTPAPTRMAPPVATFTPDEPLLAEAQALLSKASLPTGTGWVHQTFQIAQDASFNALDTGDQAEQPAQVITDAWYRLDEQGFVHTTIFIRKTLDGKFVSADINNGIYHFSFPEERGNVSQDIYLAKPDYYFDPLTAMGNFVAEGGKVNQENSVINGKTCCLYTATIIYDPPMIFWGEPSPVHSTIYSACIDTETGAVLQIQNQMKYSDGTQRIKDTTRFLLLEKVETLPDEVDQLLKKIIMP